MGQQLQFIMHIITIFNWFIFTLSFLTLWMNLWFQKHLYVEEVFTTCERTCVVKHYRYGLEFPCMFHCLRKNKFPQYSITWMIPKKWFSLVKWFNGLFIVSHSLRTSFSNACIMHIPNINLYVLVQLSILVSFTHCEPP